MGLISKRLARVVLAIEHSNEVSPRHLSDNIRLVEPPPHVCNWHTRSRRSR